jgi:hypothetical protein
MNGNKFFKGDFNHLLRSKTDERILAQDLIDEVSDNEI